jgi:hypothetical protein
MPKLFETVLTENSSITPKQAMDWLRVHINESNKISKMNPKHIIDDGKPFQRIQRISENSIGKMYFFNYDPKLKDTLPYYDTYPLVFPIAHYGDSFLGINLHYLPPKLRMMLMNALLKTLNNKKYDKTTKLIVSYQILNSAAQYKYFKPCLKKYLFSHVKSPFLYIAPDEWDIVCMLPTDRFVGAQRTTVYKDSQSMVR